MAGLGVVPRQTNHHQMILCDLLLKRVMLGGGIEGPRPSNRRRWCLEDVVCIGVRCSSISRLRGLVRPGRWLQCGPGNSWRGRAVVEGGCREAGFREGWLRCGGRVCGGLIFAGCGILCVLFAVRERS